MIKDFLRYEITKEVSEGTLKDYQLVLTKIEKDCGNDLNNISQETLKEYIHKMKRAGLTLATIKHRFYIMLAYYKWAVASEYIDVNPVEGIIDEIDKWYTMA